MQPCGLCGDLYVDVAGYCPTCRAFRGSPVPAALAATTREVAAASDPGDDWADLRSKYRTTGVLARLRRVRWRGPVVVPLVAASFGLVMVAAFAAVGLPLAEAWSSNASAVPASLPRPQDTIAPSPSPNVAASSGTGPESWESADALAESAAASGLASTEPSSEPSVAPSAEPSAAPSTSPPAPRKIDPCVVGTWKATSEGKYVDVKPGVQRFTGKGTVVRFRADGTGVFDVGAGAPLTATAGGQTWTLLYTGKIAFDQYKTVGDEVSYSEQSPSGTTTLKVNGSVTQSGALAAWRGFFHYTCSGSAMRLFVGSSGSVGNHVLELKRS